jgi:hypothetical protein
MSMNSRPEPEIEFSDTTGSKGWVASFTNIAWSRHADEILGTDTSASSWITITPTVRTGRLGRHRLARQHLLTLDLKLPLGGSCEPTGWVVSFTSIAWSRDADEILGTDTPDGRP